MVSSKTRLLTARLPNNLDERIREIALERGLTTSQLVVDILAEWVSENSHFKEEKRK